MQLTDNQIQLMIDMQIAMNDKVDPDWREYNHDWLLAASQEAGEAIDHIGWKWWKDQEMNKDQAVMELVDIWHFMISYVATKENTSLLFDFYKDWPVLINWFKHDIVNELKRFQLRCHTKRLDAALWSLMMCFVYLEVTQQDLFKKYIGKNTLNFFRQDNGYKEGTYQKIWQGLEDNEVLEQIISETDMEAPDVVEQITNQLQIRYQEHLESE